MTADVTGPAALVERRGNVLVITINRPEARNAVNSAVSIAVGDALRSRRRTIPRSRRSSSPAPATNPSAPEPISRRYRARENLFHPDHGEWGFAGYVQHYIDKPTIAAVNGTALGGGTELALASDLVVAEERAKFGLPEVKRGLIAAAGGVFRIVDQLPRKVAMELMFTGEPMSSADALKWGLINQVVPDGTAVDAALALAERITVQRAVGRVGEQAGGQRRRRRRDRRRRARLDQDHARNRRH